MKMVLATFPLLDPHELQPLMKRRSDVTIVSAPLTQEALLRLLEGDVVDILLLSSAFPGSLDPESFRLTLRQRHPTLPIVHLVPSPGRIAKGVLRDGGPHAVLSGPVRSASLQNALDDACKAALALARPDAPGTLWTVYAPLSGAGTSRLATDLWQALWTIGHRPAILVDLHPTAPDQLVRLFPQEIATAKRHALEDALEHPEGISEHLLEPPGHTGLRLLPGIWNLEEACRYDEDAYGQLLSTVRRMARAVVVDTAPPLHESSTFAALARTDHLLLPLPQRREAGFHLRRSWRLLKELGLAPDSVTLVSVGSGGEVNALREEFGLPLLTLGKDGTRRRGALLRFLKEKANAVPSPEPGRRSRRFIPFRGGIPFAR